MVRFTNQSVFLKLVVSISRLKSRLCSRIVVVVFAAKISPLKPFDMSSQFEVPAVRNVT